MRFNLSIGKNRMYRAFMNGGKSGISGSFSRFMNMSGQLGICPRFSSKAKVNGFLTGDSNNPRFNFGSCNKVASLTVEFRTKPKHRILTYALFMFRNDQRFKLLPK